MAHPEVPALRRADCRQPTLGLIDGVSAEPFTDFGDWRLRSSLALMRGALRDGTAGDLDSWVARHPVLSEALDAAATCGLINLTLDEAIAVLDGRLLQAPAGPLQRLRVALGLNADALSCFVAAGLADDDARLTALFDELHGRGGRPTRATFARCFGHSVTAQGLQALRAAACLDEIDHAVAVPAAVWDLAVGLKPAASNWHYTPAASLRSLNDLILPPAIRQRLEDCPREVPSDPTIVAEPRSALCYLLRGGPGSGRRALAGAIAREQGLGLIEASSDAGRAALGAASALLGAMPLLDATPAPGEHIVLTSPVAARGVIAIRAPRHGGVSVEGRALRRIDLEPPDVDERRQHWRLARRGAPPSEALVGLRLARGTLHRVAAALPTQGPWSLTDVIAEVEEQGRHALDGLTRRIDTLRDGEVLALPDTARREFDALVARCRQRDRLASMLPAAFAGCDGVRALFKGSSGTGKTLAARHLAAALQRPLYRVDLAATVSKYIGETERNLERVFSAAESLDIVLLLDEGDALFAGRTQVSNATDRYANLETNYLLQRLEHYTGVLLITTNAAERIDGAFTRRLDVTIEFPLPDALTRLDLWDLHLTPGHRVDAGWLEAVALRCTLSGGQIRNAALHAALLAIEAGREVEAQDIAVALQREYRKAGHQCPSLDEVS